jgi:hypothetical protein
MTLVNYAPEVPEDHDAKAVSVLFKHNGVKTWCIGRYTFGWELPYDISEHQDDFEVVAWIDLPEVAR